MIKKLLWLLFLATTPAWAVGGDTGVRNTGTFTNITVNGGLSFANPNNITGAYTATSTDTVIVANGIAGSNFTVTLPAAANKQELFVVKGDSTAAVINVQTNAITEVLYGGATFYQLNAQEQTLGVVGVASSSWTKIVDQPTPDFIGPGNTASIVTGIGIASDTIVCTFWIKHPVRVTGIRINIGATEATNVIDAGIFSSGKVLLSSATMITGSSAGANNISFLAAINLQPGKYYMGIQAAQTTALTFSASTVSAGEQPYCARYAGTTMGVSMSGTRNTTLKAPFMLGIVSGGFTQG